MLRYYDVVIGTRSRGGGGIGTRLEKMTDDRVAAITALLLQTEEAHGAYERIELGGVYDQDWPRWYAAYAVEHGIGALVGHDVTEADLATFLATSYDDFRRMEPVPAVPWAAYIARRVTAEL